MRILIISDIHANLTALDAVLADALPYDAVWCLGDLVGYGPDPNECISRVQSLPNFTCILGNHDAATLKRIDTNTFNPEARNALIWTQNQLSSPSIKFLRNLDEVLTIGDVTLAHGSPRHPIWEYLFDTHVADQNFDYFETPYCFVGHTHLPVIFTQNKDNDSIQLDYPETHNPLHLLPRTIFNPGSIGQPRDRDPRAAYAIYDDANKVINFRRVAYDIRSVQKRMLSAGLPSRHIQRLEAGW